MVTGTIVLVFLTLVLAMLWWAATTPMMYRRYLHTPPRGGRRSRWRAGHHAEHADPRTPLNEGPMLYSQFTIRWADPAQVRPALEAENALLAARLAGRIGAGDFRSGILELARHCEPHPTEIVASQLRGAVRPSGTDGLPIWLRWFD
jgi:hypothetical protein